ncbi:DUF6153 family protein [Actinocorallia sp. API 0066]|uniref:DUF6153 family protein n=1 Tax=Actinocorallia sp. API 0066 TaxID=2896846 RepID=UPI001E507D94|nr:DUF6153 family protein [Actinocorallia sp. API 0066]MCD0449795.1 DUF6153 family protein [Actinocorallia sp. API 0066]
MTGLVRTATRRSGPRRALLTLVATLLLGLLAMHALAPGTPGDVFAQPAPKEHSGSAASDDGLAKPAPKGHTLGSGDSHEVGLGQRPAPGGHGSVTGGSARQGAAVARVVAVTAEAPCHHVGGHVGHEAAPCQATGAGPVLSLPAARRPVSPEEPSGARVPAWADTAEGRAPPDLALLQLLRI